MAQTAADQALTIKRRRTYQRGGGVRPDNCIYSAGNLADPKLAEACIADLEARHVAYNKAFTARFERIYRVDRTGVRALNGKEEAPIAGAKFAAKEKGDAILVEAELPLAALPRVAAAPVGIVFLAAQPAKAAPVFTAESRTGVDIAPPVDFAPNGELRARVFEGMTPMDFRFHYQPGDPWELAITGYGDSGNETSLDASRYEEKTARLFTPQRAFGDLQVGYVYPNGIATLRGESVVGMERVRGDRAG